MKRFFLKYSLLAENVYSIKRVLTLGIPKAIEKKRILREVRGRFPYPMSLDVTPMFGFFIFHNQGNTLIWRGEKYEPEVQYALMALIGIDKMRNPKSVFADIGANIGIHTFYLKSKYPDLNVIAFDPSPASWKYMEFSIEFNKLSNTRLEKIALSDADIELDLFNWGEESSADSLRDTRRVPNKKPTLYKVPAKRLDDLDYAMEISVIKMDCEGAELSVLKGAEELIERNRPYILLEISPENLAAFGVDLKELLTYIRSCRYGIFSLDFMQMNDEKISNLLNAGICDFIILPVNALPENVSR